MYQHRIARLEADVANLYSKVNGVALASAEMTAKLDSMLLTLGELKESIQSVSERPAKLWDKLLFSVLAALGTAIGAALWMLVQEGGV